MKKLLTAVALAASVVSFPALADVGCKQGNPLNDLRVSDCDDKYGYTAMGSTIITPMPWYGADSFAYVPSRRIIRQSEPLNRHNSLEEETDLEGGSD